MHEFEYGVESKWIQEVRIVVKEKNVLLNRKGIWKV